MSVTSTTTAVTTATATVSAVTTTATVRADSGGDCGGSGGGDDDDVDSGRLQRRSPAEAEGRGSGPIWLLSIKLIRGPNYYAVGINMNENKQENNNILFGRLSRNVHTAPRVFIRGADTGSS